METKQLKVLSIEIFKTVNNLSTTFMKDICKTKINARVCPNHITTGLFTLKPLFTFWLT